MSRWVWRTGVGGESSGGGKTALSPEMRAGDSWGALEARTQDSVHKCAAPTTEWSALQGAKERRAKGSPRERTTAASRQVDAGPSCRAPVTGVLRTPRRTIGGPAESPALPRRVPSPARPFPWKVPRTQSGEEVAEPQAAGGGQKKGDKTPGGGGANLKDDRSRLLRDLRVDTKSRAAWTRLLHEHPNARKFKGGNKKGLSKGCFGLKLDRIGSMSGLGC